MKSPANLKIKNQKIYFIFASIFVFCLFSMQLILISSSNTFQNDDNDIDNKAPKSSSITWISVTHPDISYWTYVGYGCNVQWSSDGTTADTVTIELYRNSAYVGLLMSSTSNDGSEFIIFDGGLPSSSQYQIKVSSGAVTGMSSYFELLERPVITVSSPSSGQNCYLDQDFTVEWSISGQVKPYDGVKIRLLKGGSDIMWLTEQTPDDGTETFHIDAGLTQGPDYQVQVYTKDAYNNYGTSSYFTITEYIAPSPPSIGTVSGESDPIEEDQDQVLECSISDTSGSGLDWSRVYYKSSTQSWSTSRYASFSGNTATILASEYSEGAQIYYYIAAKDNENNYNFRGASGTTTSEDDAKLDAFSFSVIAASEPNDDANDTDDPKADTNDDNISVDLMIGLIIIISLILSVGIGIISVIYLKN